MSLRAEEPVRSERKPELWDSPAPTRPQSRGGRCPVCGDGSQSHRGRGLSLKHHYRSSTWFPAVLPSTSRSHSPVPNLPEPAPFRILVAAFTQHFKMMKAIPVYGRTNKKIKSDQKKKKKQLNPDTDILYFWKLLEFSKDRHCILTSPFFKISFTSCNMNNFQVIKCYSWTSVSFIFHQCLLNPFCIPAAILGIKPKG